MNDIVKKAAQLDANRQEQIANQKAAIDRLLDDRSVAEGKLSAIDTIVSEAVAEGNNSTYIDRIRDVLNG